MEKKEMLRKALDRVYKKLIAHEKNLIIWEREYVKAIETVFPKLLWWEVTDCPILQSLVENDPTKTKAQILKEYKLTEE